MNDTCGYCVLRERDNPPGLVEQAVRCITETRQKLSDQMFLIVIFSKKKGTFEVGIASKLIEHDVGYDPSS